MLKSIPNSFHTFSVEHSIQWLNPWQKNIIVYRDDLNNINDHTGRVSRFGYERVYFFLPSALRDTRRETHFIKAYYNYTTLTPTPTSAAHLVVSKIWTDLYRSKPIFVWSNQIRKTQLRILKVEYQFTHFSKFLKSQGIFSWHDIPHLLNSLQRASSSISCLRVYYDRWLSFFPYGYLSAPSDYDTWTRYTE